MKIQSRLQQFALPRNLVSRSTPSGLPPVLDALVGSVAKPARPQPLSLAALRKTRQVPEGAAVEVGKKEPPLSLGEARRRLRDPHLLPWKAAEILGPLVVDAPDNRVAVKLSIEKLGPRKTFQLLEMRNRERHTRLGGLWEAVGTGQFKPEPKELRWVVADLTRPGLQQDRLEFLAEAARDRPEILEGFQVVDGRGRQLDFRDYLVDELVTNPEASTRELPVLPELWSRVVFSGPRAAARVQQVVEALSSAPASDNPERTDLLLTLALAAPRDPRQNQMLDECLSRLPEDRDSEALKAYRADRFERRLARLSVNQLLDSWHDLSREPVDRAEGLMLCRLLGSRPWFVKEHGSALAPAVLESARDGKLEDALECLRLAEGGSGDQKRIFLDASSRGLSPDRLKTDLEVYRMVEVLRPGEPSHQFYWDAFLKVRDLVNETFPVDRVKSHLARLRYPETDPRRPLRDYALVRAGGSEEVEPRLERMVKLNAFRTSMGDNFQQVWQDLEQRVSDGEDFEAALDQLEVLERDCGFRDLDTAYLAGRRKIEVPEPPAQKS